MLGLPFHHIGYVVDDLETAVHDAVARFGAGPFYVAEHMEFEECTFKGEPAVFDHSSAFGQWGPVRIEFTVIHHTEPAELGLTMAPSPGHPHHVGILVDSLEDASAQLEANGLPVYHTGRTGPVSARYHDARAPPARRHPRRLGGGRGPAGGAKGVPVFPPGSPRPVFCGLSRRARAPRPLDR